MSGVDGAWLAATRQRRGWNSGLLPRQGGDHRHQRHAVHPQAGGGRGYHEELGQTPIVSELLADMAAKGFDPELVRRSYERYAARMGAGTDGRISATGLVSSTANGPVSRSALLRTASMLCDSP
jgi:hypothetical protein